MSNKIGGEKMSDSLKTQEKVKHTYTKDMLIRSIADTCHKDMGTVRIFYNALEENVAKLLSSATSDADISIRLFEGITLGSTFVPEKTKVNNLTGKFITATSKIKPKANITRSYRDKLTTNNK